MVRDILNSSYEELEKKKTYKILVWKRKKESQPGIRKGKNANLPYGVARKDKVLSSEKYNIESISSVGRASALQAEVARFISEPIYQEVSFMKFYKAVLENKEGKFTCSFGIEFLENNEPLTSWEETSRTESKAIKEESKQEIQEKLKIVKCSDKPYLKFGITDSPQHQINLDANPALNHLKNIYINLTNIDIYHLFKDIQERIKVIEELRKDSDKFQKVREQFFELAEKPDFYKKAPWLTIAEELFNARKEGLIGELIIISTTRGKDNRKKSKFQKTFGKFPQSSLLIKVKVITGQHRGKIDYISRLDRKNQIVYLKKVSRKKYDKSTAESKEKKELKEIMVPLSLSNVAYWLEDKKKITKIGFQIVDGKKLPGNKDFNTILRMALNHATKELSGYFWECLPVSKKTINRPFNFPNQRKDSVLVIPIPKPGPDLDFKNISQFTKNAPDEQQQAF
ncbi:7931_t:CDS:2 [Entrophospora sp. SA101]|nr:7931_t:CDS:2 [Entrophospora sp. SA101]